MYKVSVNKNDFHLSFNQDKLEINGNEENWDVAHIRGHQYHIIKDGYSFSLEVLEIDRSAKAMRLRVNGHDYQLDIQDRFDLLLEKLGMHKSDSGQVHQLKAPMPGRILAIQAVEGEEVAKGDTLIVLEAMKMENSIKSPSDGIIRSVVVKPGDRVEKNQLLIEF